MKIQNYNPPDDGLYRFVLNSVEVKETIYGERLMWLFEELDHGVEVVGFTSLSTSTQANAYKWARALNPGEAINLKLGKVVQSDYISDETTDETTLEEFAAKEQLEALRVSAKLSAREDQVLELILKDYLDREIACELGIDEGSVKTIKSFRQ